VHENERRWRVFSERVEQILASAETKTADASRVMRRWIQAWPGGALIGVGNGIAREATYGKVLGERAAHQVSTATAIAAFAAYFNLLQRRFPLPSAEDARRAGLAWLALTVVFEFGFGRLVAKQSWRQLLADYNLAAGRTWPLVLAWIAIGPTVIRARRAVR
jgi:hypothetical protein